MLFLSHQRQPELPLVAQCELLAATTLAGFCDGHLCADTCKRCLKCWHKTLQDLLCCAVLIVRVNNMQQHCCALESCKLATAAHMCMQHVCNDFSAHVYTEILQDAQWEIVMHSAGRYTRVEFFVVLKFFKRSVTFKTLKVCLLQMNIAGCS